MNKIEETLHEQTIIELANYLITFANFLKLNDKRITKLEDQYSEIRQRLEREVVN